MVQTMQAAIDKALAWGSENNLKFSAPKTVAVLFTRIWKFTQPPCLKMGGEEIEYSDSARYLGVTLDSKLSWKKHLKAKAKDAKRKILIMSNAMGKLWGAPPIMTRWAYTGIIRPSLTYGAYVWAEAMTKKGNVDLLLKVNRLACLMMGNFRRSTPTAGLEILFNIPPLHLYVQQRAITTHTRLWGNDSRRMADSTHRKSAQKHLDRMGIPAFQRDSSKGEYRWDKKYKLDHDSLKTGKPLIEPNGDISVYTDGSLLENSRGSSFVMYQNGKIISQNYYHVREPITVYQAELCAINCAALELIRMNTASPIYIYVDSQAAIRSLFKYFVTSEILKKTIDNLNVLGEGQPIHIRWVKAHVGYEGNEMADQLAKQGALSPNKVITSFRVGIPDSYVKSLIWEQHFNSWSLSWESLPTCRQTKIWFPKPDKSKSAIILTQDRKRISWLVQIFTGHNFLNRHDALVDPEKDPTCRLCEEEEETSFHLVAECPALAWLRMQVFGGRF